MSILSSLTATVSLAYMMAAMWRMAHTMRRNRLLALANDSTRRLRVVEKLLKNKKRSHRRFWVRPGRTSIWWKNFVKEVVIPEEWRENFRMSRYNFFTLSEQLRPHLEKQITNMRLPISVEKQVAIFLYYIADEGRYRKVANSFGISRAAVSKIIKKVSMVISLHLGPKYIKLPQTEEEVTTAASMFFEKHGFPQCI